MALNIKNSALSADSSDDEVPVASHLNADSSDEDIRNRKLNADSSDDEFPLTATANRMNAADSSDDEQSTIKASSSASRSNTIAADSSDDDEPIQRKTKVNAVDSSDDESVSTGHNKGSPTRRAQASLDSSDDEKALDINKSTLICKNNDGDDDSVEISQSVSKRKKKVKRMVDSDSEDETGSQNSTSTPASKSKLDESLSRNIFQNKDLYDAESSEDELPEVTKTSNKYNSDSENEDMESLDSIKGKVIEKHKRSPKPDRSAAKNAMMEIRSESARITRESAVGLPYHKPKQRSLEEFLNRKKGTPDILKSIHGKKFDSQADKLLEEREKQIKEFYKSESEEENDEGDEDYNPSNEHDGDKSVLRQSEDNDAKISEEDNSQEIICSDTKESKGVDSGIFSASGTSDESNTNTDEDKSNPASPGKQDVKDVISSSNNLNLQEGETEESLKLVLEPDTPNVDSDDEIVFSSQVQKTDPISDKTLAKINALKHKFGDISSLEKTLQMTPTISSGADEDLIFNESKNETLSDGAQKLFSRFVNHAKACSKDGGVKTGYEQENLTIVSKKTVNGVEVLEQDVVTYKYEKPKEKPKLNPGTAFLSLKEKLKKEMIEKRKVERSKRAEILKINNEEGGYDELPDEEDIDNENLDEEEMEDEEYEYEDDDDEAEEDLEQEDEERIEGRIKSAFADDEAEDDGDTYDNDSVALEDIPKKSHFKKIVDPDLLSESSNTSDLFNKLDRIRSDAETPTLNQSKLNQTSAPSSNSSFGALISVEPRWTPFQDRISAGTVELNSAENTLQESPTNSQLAKKKLGFEGLFDQTDPDVTDIDDVVGLCSGKFVTQDACMSQAAKLASGQFSTQHKFTHDISGLTPLEKTKVDSIESQDTVILGEDISRPSSRVSHNIETQDTIILSGNVEQNVSNAISSLDKMLSVDEHQDGVPGHGAIESDDDDEEGGLKISKKRKRRMVSESEESDNELDCVLNEPEEVKDNKKQDDDDECTSDENVLRKPNFKQQLFNKKGKLRKDFYEAEAELSGGSDEEFSDDEDERGLDRLEMEEGDLDDIDNDEEAEKVGRIHQKVLLDEDQANLKLFQERFLEDGDLHTDYKRQKQFKWSGLDDNIEVGPRKDEDVGDQEEETIEKWRLAKMEREKWLKEQEKKKGKSADVVEDEDSQFFQLADRTLQRMSSKDDSVTSVDIGGNEKIFKSPPAKFGPLQPLQNLGGGMRGSFLARGDASLDKIAQFNKVKDDRVGSGAKGRNFVFAAISPPKRTTMEDDSSPGEKKVKQPPTKKARRCRTLDENSKGTIFNLL